MSQHLIGVPVVLKAPVDMYRQLKLNTTQDNTECCTQKCMSHFPLSFTASSNLPSDMAVVTSFV